MTCERCGTNVDRGRLVVRRTFAGFACHGCAEEIKRLEWEAMNMAKKNGNKKSAMATGKAAKPQGAKREGSLAAIIDLMLLGGGMTVGEIAAELAKKAGDAGKNRDLAANVRARMVSYTRKGWRVEKDDKKRVKVLQNA